jgi:hypothetical protein
MKPNPKWTPKRMALLALSLGIVVFFGRKIIQDLIRDSESRYVYAFIFCVAAVAIAVTSAPKSRDFILQNSKSVILAGWLIIAVSAIWIAGYIYLVVTLGEVSSPISGDIGEYIAVALFLIGLMVASSPRMICEAKEWRDYLRENPP